MSCVDHKGCGTRCTRFGCLSTKKLLTRYLAPLHNILDFGFLGEIVSNVPVAVFAKFQEIKVANGP